jgi:predicted dinucleotide-binding enzyme
MNYAIIGAGAIGHALATQFARQSVEVRLANSRGPQSLAQLVDELGSAVLPSSLEEALAAEVVILAVPFGAIRSMLETAGAGLDWRGRIVVDATNAIAFPDFKPANLGERLSSEIVAEAVKGARVVKAFNTIPAAVLAAPPAEAGGRRVVMLSGDDTAAKETVSDLVGRLGFAAIDLGTLRRASHLQQFGGALVAANLVRIT